MSGSTAARALGEYSEMQRHIVLLAASGERPIRGEVRLQHMMYMASRRSRSAIGDAGFAPGGRGPHSGMVAEELGRLERAGILCVDWDVYPTRKGREVAERLAGETDRRALDALDNYKEFANELDDDELLVFSFCTYPDMTTDSEDYGRLRPLARRHAINMAVDGKVTAGCAAMLIGASKLEMMREVGRRRPYFQ